MDEKVLGVGSRVRHPAYGEGAIVKLNVAAYTVCFMQYGLKHVGKDYAEWDIIEHVEADEEITFTKAEKSLIRILKTWSDATQIVPLGDKWKNGILIMKPDDADLKPKEIPIETFFHKIVMVRDRLRVMEQRINAHKVMSDEEKVNLQQYITRVYGSLTSFNVLFKYKDDHFVGERS